MKIAFVFPGQGSQSVGMLDAWKDCPAVADKLAYASQALGQDLATLMAQGPLAALNQTVNTQPAMLAADVAVYAAWQAAGGPVPAVMAGHSLGEYAALVVANALRFDDALRVVRIRAEAMQAAVPVNTGAMAAILGLDEAAVRALCRECTMAQPSAIGAQPSGTEAQSLAIGAQTQHGIVEAVNFNTPTQVVIAGHKDAVERACVAARAQGARRAVLLPVSAPFHSSLLKDAAQTLDQALKSVHLAAPAIPVINNVDVACLTEPAAIRDALVRQAWHPVRWVETIRTMRDQGVTHIIECGPGKVLSGLIKQIDPTLSRFTLHDPRSLELALEAILNATACC